MSVRVSILVFVALSSLTLVGCSSQIRMVGGKNVLWLGHKPMKQILARAGYTNTYLTSVRRDSTGERVFLQFDDYKGTYRVAIVDSNGVRIKELPGFAWLNDQGDPVCWFNDERRAWQLSDNSNLPTNLFVVWYYAGYVGMSDVPRTRLWIARVEAPSQEIVVLPPHAIHFEGLFVSKDKLHVFYTASSMESSSKRVKQVLMYHEYLVEGGRATLVREQELKWTRRVLDFDDQNHLLLAQSTGDMFPHGWLADLDTAVRKRVGIRGNHGFFLSDGVIRQFQESTKAHH